MTQTAKPTNPSTWVTAEVVEVRVQTPTIKTFVFRLPHLVVHLPGQNYELRLTSVDGYKAARPYSASSLGNDTETLALTIAELANGEVSHYLHDHIQPGDEVELRGPFGGFFVWRPEDTVPVLLVGGGSGVVPLRTIWLAHQTLGAGAPLQLLYSARSFDDIVYRDDLLSDPEHVTITLSRSQPEDWHGGSGRLDREALQHALEQLPSVPTCYVCGVNQFVEAITSQLVALGVPPARIKAERFGA